MPYLCMTRNTRSRKGGFDSSTQNFLFCYKFSAQRNNGDVVSDGHSVCLMFGITQQILMQFYMIGLLERFVVRRT